MRERVLRGGKMSVRTAALLLMVPLTFALPARGDAHDVAMARALVAKEKALDSNDPADWEAALKLFEEADLLRPTSVSKYELAVAAARLKEEDLAVESYETAIELGLDGSARDKATAFIAAHSASMGRLTIEGPKGTRVIVSGRSRGRLPRKPLVLFTGAAHVTLIDPSGTRTEHDVEVSVATTLDVRPKDVVKVAPKPVPKPSPVTDTKPEKPGTPLIVGGSAVAAVSLGFLVTSAIVVSRRRDSLDTTCVQRVGDECEATTADKHDAAASDRDAIRTWKTIEVTSAIGLGVGVVAAAVGIAWNLSVTPRVAVSGSSFSVAFVGSF
jgi:hypothetical protein